MCELLQDAGIQVKGLVLIDSPYPVDHEPLPQGVISHITRSSPAASHGTALAKEFEVNASLLSSYKPHPVSDKYRVKTVMLRSEETFDTQSICGTQYEWLSSQRTRDRAIAGWENLIGDVIHVLPIPGHHFEAFASHNVSLSPQLLGERASNKS
jgi:thioesterase domain-containing protein